MDDYIIYRWYWLCSTKGSSTKEWRSTCWKSGTAEGAIQVSHKELYQSDVGSKKSKLVRETTKFESVNL